MTPLAFACMTGDLALVAFVYSHGGAADVTATDYAGWTPLLRAARQVGVERRERASVLALAHRR